MSDSATRSRTDCHGTRPDAAQGVIVTVAVLWPPRVARPWGLLRMTPKLLPTVAPGRSGMRKIKTGAWRTGGMEVVSGPEGKQKLHFEAPAAEAVGPEMKAFLTWYEDSATGTEPLIKAGLAHLYFVTIHPFEDGNGRLGRAVFDLALALGATFHSKRTSRLWAVSPVLLKHRKEYYAQLEAAQKGDLDITDWLSWSIASVEQACDDARVCIERVVQVAHFWTRHRETNMSPRQRRLLEMALAPNDPESGWLTAKRAARQTKVERVTASRDLARLEELGVIQKDPGAGGRSTRYSVRLDVKEPLRLIEELKWN